MGVLRTQVLIRVLAAVLCVAAVNLTRLPDAGASKGDLARNFAFRSVAIDGPGTGPGLRPVAPAYERIRSWISSVGAGIGMFDADGGGVADDLCHVDPRTDHVTVQPAPGTHQGYRPFTLGLGGLPHTSWTAPMGCLPGDVNEDGHSDVVVYYWGRSPVAFLSDGGPPRAASYTPRDLVRPYQVWNTNAATLADVDGDGHLDLLFGNYFPDGARVLDPTAHQSSLQMNRSMSDAANGGTDRILRFTSATGGDRPDVRFTDEKGAIPARSAARWTLATGAQDINGDGLPELYFANDFGPDDLMLNRSKPGHIRLERLSGARGPLTPKSKQFGNDSFKGMGVAFTDLDGDPVPDIVVSNITEPYALQESNFAWTSRGAPGRLGDGRAPYTDHSERLGLSRSGWGWDIKAADFNGDGTDEYVQATGFLRGTVDRWPQLQELAMTNDDLLDSPSLWPRFRPGDDVSGHDPNAFFTRGPNGRYANIGRELGLGDTVTRSIAVGDVNADARPDFATASQWDQSRLFVNRAEKAVFLALSPRIPATCRDRTDATRPAVGAAVEVRRGGRVHRSQLYPANGHGGVNAPELYFGLTGAAADRPVPVTLHWRDACGAGHDTTTRLRPGRHTVLLRPDGSVKEG